MNTYDEHSNMPLQLTVPEPEQPGLNIAYVYGSLYNPASGVSNYIETVGNYFQRRGNNVNFLVAKSLNENDPRVRSLGRVVMASINGSESGLALPISKKLAQETLEELQPDVLDVQIYTPLFDGRFVSVVSDETAVVGRFHILPASWKVEMLTKGLRLVTRAARRRFDYISSTSKPAQEFARSAVGIESSVIPNPVDIDRFAAGERLPQYDDGKTNIVFLGRLDERKGAQYLLSAISALKEDTLKQVRVIIAGKGPMRPVLESLVSRHQLEDVVEFLGYVEEADKPNLLASADIATFPAVTGESFGIVLVEAMAARAGVVLGGDNPGYRSVLGGVPDTLVDPCDIVGFAARLQELISDQDKCAEIHAYQQQAVSQYGIEVVGPQLAKAYTEALAKRAA